MINRRTAIGAGLAALMDAALGPAHADLSAAAVEQDALRLVPDLLLPSQLLLGHHLVAHLSAKADTNIMVSPASLAAVLAMLSTGASYPLRRAIHRVLAFRGTSSRISARDLSGLNAAVGHVLRQAGAESPLALANMIVFDPASKPDPQALARLSVEGADVSVEDLRKPETVKRINEWVAARTHNLIPSILNDPLSHPGLVAVNALYFKDRWRVPFDRAQTTTEKFYLAGEKSVDVSMMYSPDGRYRFREDGKFIAAELPYKNDDFKLVVVTTKRHSARRGEFARVAGWLGGEDFTEQDGLVALPRMALSGDVELLTALDAMGLAPARLRHDAFRRLAAAPQTLSRVLQKTELKIDEEGTESAAATAATTWRSASTESFTKMVVNKPFVFALRDKRTGLVLLSGYVATPNSPG